MAWCHQAPSHYMSQCWPRSMSPYGANRPQWIKYVHEDPIFHWWLMDIYCSPWLLLFVLSMIYILLLCMGIVMYWLINVSSINMMFIKFMLLIVMTKVCWFCLQVDCCVEPWLSCRTITMSTPSSPWVLPRGDSMEVRAGGIVTHWFLGDVTAILEILFFKFLSRINILRAFPVKLPEDECQKTSLKISQH